MGTSAPSEQVRNALDGLNYPASKEDILAHVRDVAGLHYEDPVTRLLRGLPVAIYERRADVMAALPYDQGEAGEGQDTDDRMNERRHHTHPGLAEHEKDAPQAPIKEELGENRGS